MRSYLVDFLKNCSYEAGDQSFLMQAYDRLCGKEEANALFAEAVSLYGEDGACDYEHARGLADKGGRIAGVHPYTAELLLYLCFTRNLRTRYAKKGVSEEIFWNSVMDLKYKNEECKLVKGIVGSFVAPWFDGFFEMTRFALGRLQFETKGFHRSYEKNGRVLTPDSVVINVHIPRTGTPLTRESCDEAYAMAKHFFGETTGECCAFVCHSWLLFPENKQLLSPHSNIYRFLSDFDIFEWGYDPHMENLWRLFDTDEKNPYRLPADTSMRRAYAEYLKGGGLLGWGYGVFFA